MPTKKKTPAKKKASKPSVKRTVKRAVKKVAAKAAPKKTTSKKPKAKTTKTTERPVGPREHALASSALKLVDEAAALLRRGIRTGADTTEKSRLEAKKRAHDLLSKATSSLGGIFESSADALHKAISKL